MNLRMLACAALLINLSYVPLSFADRGHHHHHNHELAKFLGKATFNDLVSRVIEQHDEIECLREDNSKLKKGLLPKKLQVMGWSAVGGAAGAVVLFAAAKAYFGS